MYVLPPGVALGEELGPRLFHLIRAQAVVPVEQLQPLHLRLLFLCVGERDGREGRGVRGMGGGEGWEGVRDGRG